MTEKPRINLTVDVDTPELLERLAGSRNKMGQYLSDLVRNLAQGNAIADEVEKLDREGLRLMVLGLSGRVTALEGQYLHLQSQVARLIADKSE